MEFIFVLAEIIFVLANIALLVFAIVCVEPRLRTFAAKILEPDATKRIQSPSTAGDADIRDALARGNKIEAIKMYRNRYATGLKEAKEAVEGMENQ
ncbi:hypothetical protein BH09SUM1_BH09SUM1_21550 [soil metagenome]